MTCYDLDVMTPDQALELLRLSIQDNLTDADVPLARSLAATVGYLPLALELAAMQVYHYGVSWRELLADLNREIAYLEALDLPGADTIESESVRKHYSLLASFNLSLRRLKPQELEWFAWLGVLPSGVSLTPALMMTVWQLDAAVGSKTLRDFKSKALLLSGSPLADGTPTYRLHDLLHDLARGLLTGTGSQSNDRFPDLGLTLPLTHALLRERYRAKTEKGLWHTLLDDGYIHAHLSWHLVQAGRVDELHQLLQEETDKGRNGWYEACDRLGQRDIFVRDVTRAWELAEATFESDPSRAIALQCRYALIISSLNSLVGNIPAELMAALVSKGVWTPAQGLSYARQVQNLSDRANALGKLAAHLSENILQEALDTARAIQDEDRRARALSALAANLPEILPEALSTARAIQDEDCRARALSALAAHLPEHLLPEAFDTARAIQHELCRAEALSALAAHLPEHLLPEALSTARAIQNEYSRARALSALAAHLPEHLLPEALSTVQNEYSRPSIFKTAQEIIFEQDLADALSALAAHLPEHLLPEALDTARAIQDSESLVEALRDLAAHLPEHLLPKALSTVRAIDNERVRAKALSALAARLPKQLLPKALFTVWGIKYEEARDDALSGLAAHLPKNLLAEALSTVRAIQDKKARAKALSALAAYDRENLLPEALDTARAIQDEKARAKAPSALAARMSEDLLPEALSTVRAIRDDYSRAKALSALVPHFPEVLPEALDTIRVTQYQENRAELLCALAPHMTENLLPIALDIARAIRSKHVRAEPLSALVPHAPEILPETLDAVKAISHEDRRAEALCALAPHISENLLPVALDIAQNIKRLSCRAKAFNEIARARKHVPANFSLWQETLHNLVARRRSDFLEDLVELVPVMIELGGTESLGEIARAIVDVGRQWP
ncbi:MAG: hypothetical protein AB4352_20605 [Hormoscilla sp.]